MAALGSTRHANVWEETATAAPVVPVLEREEHAQVLIVGAGYLGLSAALHLAEAGADVAVARRGGTRMGRVGTQRRAAHPRTQVRSARARGDVRPRTRRAHRALRRRDGRCGVRFHRPPWARLRRAARALDPGVAFDESGRPRTTTCRGLDEARGAGRPSRPRTGRGGCRHRYLRRGVRRSPRRCAATALLRA